MTPFVRPYLVLKILAKIKVMGASKLSLIDTLILFNFLSFVAFSKIEPRNAKFVVSSLKSHRCIKFTLEDSQDENPHLIFELQSDSIPVYFQNDRAIIEVNKNCKLMLSLAKGADNKITLVGI